MVDKTDPRFLTFLKGRKPSDRERYGEPGYMYPGDYHIRHYTHGHPRYHLIYENHDFGGDLLDLEFKLFNLLVEAGEIK